MSFRFPLLHLLIFSLAFTSPAQAQLSVAEMKSQLGTLENSELPDSEKVAFKSLLEQAISFEGSIAAASQKLDSFTEKESSIEVETAAFNKKLSEQSGGNLTEAPEEFSDLEKISAKTEAELEAAKLAQATLAADVAQQRAALESLPQAIEGNQEKLTLMGPAAEQPPVAAVGDFDEKWLEWLVDNRKRAALKAEIAASTAELNFARDSDPWIAVRRDYLMGETARLTREFDFYSKALTERRSNRVDASIALARTEAAKARKDGNEELVAIADENIRLSEMRAGELGFLSRIASISKEATQMEAQSKQIGEQSISAERRLNLLESAGLTIDEETGAMLREQRRFLPQAADLKRKLATGIQEAASNQLVLLKLEEQRRGMAGTFVNLEIESVDEKSKVLLSSQRDLLNAAIRDAQTLQERLEARNRSVKQNLDSAFVFENYLNEKLVWIRSASALNWRDFPAEIRALLDFLKGTAPMLWLAALATDFQRVPMLWILSIVAMGYLIWKRRSMKAEIERTGRMAVNRSCRTIRPTFRSLVATLGRVASVMLPLWFLIWRSSQPPTVIALGLIPVASTLSLLIFLREVNRDPNGLFIAHFGRKALIANRVKADVSWIAWLIPLPLFLSSALAAIHQTGGNGRLFFIVLNIIVVIFVHRLVRPSSGLLDGLSLRGPYLRLIYLLSVGAPVAMIIGAAFGYLTSMRNLSAQLLETGLIVFVVVLVAAFLYRWVLVSRRKVAARQAAEKRKAEAALEEAKVAGDHKLVRAPFRSLSEIENQAASLAKVEGDTHKLIRIAALALALLGVWAVWAPSLPALSALDRVELWEAAGEAAPVAETGGGDVISSMTNPSGNGESNSGSESVSVAKDRIVSLQDLLVATFLLILTFFAAKQLPSILELLVFQKLNLEPGGAFAFTTTLRYILVAVGVSLVFSRLEIDWSKIQWIAAAISFGIGFGLQEIFANFVAGIIILFERPIRLGDYVTLGDLSGHVTKIRIRATTIRDFSNKELVVPNREFITGKLVNWTLSDPVIRVEIPVGIAYGSDTGVAKRIMLEVGQENTNVIETPAPNVLFKNFGESSLDFELRVHIRDSNMIHAVQSEIRFEIDQRFRAAGIEISFPQRDLHIRSIDATLPIIKREE